MSASIPRALFISDSLTERATILLRFGSRQCHLPRRRIGTTIAPRTDHERTPPVVCLLSAAIRRTIAARSFLINELAANEVELLQELVPKATVVGVLTKLRDPNYESDTKGAQAVADTFGDRPIVVKASTQREIDPAFVALVRRKIRQH